MDANVLSANLRIIVLEAQVLSSTKREAKIPHAVHARMGLLQRHVRAGSECSDVTGSAGECNVCTSQHNLSRLMRPDERQE